MKGGDVMGKLCQFIGEVLIFAAGVMGGVCLVLLTLDPMGPWEGWQAFYTLPASAYLMAAVAAIGLSLLLKKE